MIVDQTDRQILAFLSLDARIPFLEIARKLKVSEGTVRNRVAKLVESGVIRKFTVEWAEQGGVEAVVGLRTDTRRNTTAIAHSIKKVSSHVRQVIEVSGNVDMLVFIDAMTLNELNTLLEKLRAVGGVVDTHTYMVLNRV